MVRPDRGLPPQGGSHRRLGLGAVAVTNLAFSRDSQTLFAVTDASNAALRSWNIETKRKRCWGRPIRNTISAWPSIRRASWRPPPTAPASGETVQHPASGAALMASVGDKPGATFVDSIAFTAEGRYPHDDRPHHHSLQVSCVFLGRTLVGMRR